MNSESFCYWLQGCFEIHDLKTLDEKQTQIIKDHLNLVFNKVTPERKGVDQDRYIETFPETERDRIICSSIHDQDPTKRKFC